MELRIPLTYRQPVRSTLYAQVIGWFFDWLRKQWRSPDELRIESCRIWEFTAQVCKVVEGCVRYNSKVMLYCNLCIHVCICICICTCICICSCIYRLSIIGYPIQTLIHAYAVFGKMMMNRRIQDI